MVHGKFVWTDLSTFNIEKTQEFYKNSLKWKLNSNEYGYLSFKFEEEFITGMFEMPDKFKNMNMPSFWMPYFSVDSVDTCIEKAKEIGGRVELEEESRFYGKIALIRDPLGAGFTVCEEQFNAYSEEMQNRIDVSLTVSNFSKVGSFYQEIFDWQLEKENEYTWNILQSDQNYVGRVLELPDSVKGKFEYWGMSFEVSDFENVLKRIIENGGTVLNLNSDHALIYDPNRAFFNIFTSEI